MTTNKKNNNLGLTQHEEPTIDFYQDNPRIISGPGIVLVKDLEHSFVASNVIFSKFSGVRPDRLQGLTDYDMPWAEHSDIYISHEEAILSGNSYSVIEPLNGCLNSIIHTSKKIIFDSNGNPAGTIAMALIIDNPVKFENIVSISQTYKIASYGHYKLSMMETKVLYFLLKGVSRGHMSEKLNVSAGTVDTYLRRIRAKFGVSSNVTLIEKCIFNDFHNHFPFQIVT